MSEGRAEELERPRAAGDLLEGTGRLFGRHWRTFVVLALAVVVPVDLVVLGIGVGQLTDGYDGKPSSAVLGLEVAVSLLVTTPLVTAMVVPVILDAAAGRAVSIRAAVQSGLDAFPAVFAAIMVYAAVVVLGLALFVLPGIYAAIRGYFVAQLVVIEGRRGADALRRSAELTAGRFWRTFGLVTILNLGIAVPAALITLPLDAVARSADAQAVALAGTMLGQLLTLPVVAIGGTLLLFDLRARNRPG